jgi:5-methylcytosine-specific restriction endonuclease McrA
VNRSRQMFYDSPAWRQVRLVVLERDEHLCQLRGPKCKVAATEVDHIIRPEDGGDWYAVENLRGSCKPCNAARGGRAGAAKTNASSTMTALRPSREW